MKAFELKNLEKQKISELVFPELKQYANLNQYLKTVYYKDLDTTEEYFCIQDERERNDKKIEDSIWIRNEDIGKLLHVIDKVSEIRKDKENKKTENKSKLIKEKELKFNKIYDREDLPKNQRKRVYEYFVLNDKMSIRNIKLKNIENFLNDTDQIESKNLTKIIKKKLNQFVSDKSDWFLDNYSLKKKVSIYIPLLNETFERSIEIMYINKKEIIKIKSLLENENDIENLDIESIVFQFYNDRQLKKKNYEEYHILKMYYHIIENLNMDSLIYENFISAFKQVLYIYNKDEMYNSFVLKLFNQYLKDNNCFSENQNKQFSQRRKFRNKTVLRINEEYAILGIFLDYEKDIKEEFKNLLKNNIGLNNDDFNFFIDTLNNKIVSEKITFFRHIIDDEIKNSIKLYTENSKSKFNAYPLISLNEEQLTKTFYNDFLKVYMKEIGREPENLKKELSIEKIKAITVYNELDFYDIIKNYLVKTIFKIDYKNSFDLARKYKRKIHFIIGQTNSGKTYTAFNRLVEAKSGAYLSPLRLLALEGQREIEERGKLCSMLTGEEKNIKEGSTFTSSTIEMLNINDSKEKIVIDEIQMIKDEHRGWAWVQALIGSPAEEIILTGSEEVMEIVKKIADYTNDEFSFEKLYRKSPLVMMDDVTSLKKIKKGTALIAFSRRKVLELRSELKDRKVSVIYGNLGPEVRKEEARKFREGETDILIATDAIAMGLNLPIENVIFTTHEKSIKNVKIELEQQMVQQIGGRAGRYGLKDVGYIGALNGKTLNFVKNMINKPLQIYNGKVPIMPNVKYLKEISDIIKTDKMAVLLDSFERFATFNSDLFYCTDLTRQIELAKEIDKYNFTIEEAYTLSSAPVRESYEGGLDYFLKCVEKVVEFNASSENYKMLRSPSISKFENKLKTHDSEILRQAEELMHDLELYYWFGNKYPQIFMDIEGVIQKREVLNNFIINSLKKA